MGVREKYAHLPPLEKPLQLRGIAALFARHPVRLVYLFGSAARVPEAAEDVDLAFLPDPGFRFQSFYADLSEALGTDRLDLVELPTAPLWLREEILRTGICLYEREPRERIRWEAATRALLRERGLRILRSNGEVREEVMGLNRAFLAAALEELQKVGAELAKYRTVTVVELESNLSLRWTVERGLLAGLTLMFQVADHILAENLGRKPETYERLLRELCMAGVISQSLYASLRGVGGFRNVLVHEYVRIDLRHVLEALQKAPEQFAAFAREVAVWLEQQTEG